MRRCQKAEDNSPSEGPEGFFPISRCLYLFQSFGCLDLTRFSPSAIKNNI